MWSYTGAEEACEWRYRAMLGCGDSVNSGMLVLNGLHWLASQVQLRRMHAARRSDLEASQPAYDFTSF